LDYDSESSTDHATFRNYALAAGRWLSPDPYNGSYNFTNSQSLNRYTYAVNNPLMLRDPLGLEDSDCGDDDSCSDGSGGNGNSGNSGNGGNVNGYPPGTVLQDQNGNYYIRDQ
jgi:RHS repeat-associated protein